MTAVFRDLLVVNGEDGAFLDTHLHSNLVICQLMKQIAALAHHLARQSHVFLKLGLVRCDAKSIRATRSGRQNRLSRP
jgi:hypothetical protein